MKGWQLLHQLAHLTVDELNLEVWIEGCDCNGESAQLKTIKNELTGQEYLLIKRADD